MTPDWKSKDEIEGLKIVEAGVLKYNKNFYLKCIDKKIVNDVRYKESRKTIEINEEHFKRKRTSRVSAKAVALANNLTEAIKQARSLNAKNKAKKLEDNQIG